MSEGIAIRVGGAAAMSFFIDFNAKTPAQAREKLASWSLPPSVEAFIGAAIDGIEKYMPEGAEYAIVVHADGHLCDGDNHEVSTANLSVKPIVF